MKILGVSFWFMLIVIILIILLKKKTQASTFGTGIITLTAGAETIRIVTGENIPGIILY